MADISQTSATVSWSIGETQEVDFIVVYYRAPDATEWTQIRDASQNTSYIVSTLDPGTEYQFYVLITSYGKTSTSDNFTATTGKMQLLYTYMFFFLA